MKISEKEEKLIREGKIHAILRWEKPSEKIGDIVFSIDGQAYKMIEKKRWKVFRCAAQRSHIDFGCRTVYDFKVLIGELYDNYPKIKDDRIYLCIVKAEKGQMTLGV